MAESTVWFVADVAGNRDAETDIIFDQLDIINFHFRSQNNFDRRLTCMHTDRQTHVLLPNNSAMEVTCLKSTTTSDKSKAHTNNT